MKEYLLILIVSISFSNLFGQTIEELEYELSFHTALEKNGGKISTARKLFELDPLNENAIKYICIYYYDRKIDSVSFILDNLIAIHPYNAEPFIIRSKLLYYENDRLENIEYTKQKLKYLKSALKIEKDNEFALYSLVETYYNDYLLPLRKERDNKWNIDSESIDSTIISKPIQKGKISMFENPGDSALKYFYRLWEVDTVKRDVIYFPIRQIEYSLSKLVNTPIKNGIPQKNYNYYFSSWYFADLKEDWECDSSIDYLSRIDESKRRSQWITIQLTGLNEPCLNKINNLDSSTIYRFTWLRSFHNPISIRIEKNNDKIMLFWKMGKGASGYGPEGIKKFGKKKLKESDWYKFIQLTTKIKIDSLSNNISDYNCDGASWILEKKTVDGYKAHSTDQPFGYFKETCLFLLELSNIRVKEKYIY